MMNTLYKGIIREGRVEFETAMKLPEGSQVMVLAAQFDEQSARRTANTWLAEHVGNVVGTEKQGFLLQSRQQTIWRFEVFVSGASYTSPMGSLGQVDVEANTGQILNTAQTAQDMIYRAKKLSLNS